MKFTNLFAAVVSICFALILEPASPIGFIITVILAALVFEGIIIKMTPEEKIVDRSNINIDIEIPEVVDENNTCEK